MKKLSIILLIAACFASQTYSSQQKKVKAKQETLKSKHLDTPDQVLAELKAGNLRFTEDKTINHEYKKHISYTKDDQHPHTLVLGCLDSRVPPEIIFDQKIGDMFVARVAGNVENPNVVGSMEFATKVKGSKVIVVLGHNKCGAVNGAISDVKLGSLTQLLDQIKPSIVDNDAGKTAKKNVEHTIEDILQQSPIIKELVNQGKVKIVGAMYDIETGKVQFL